MDTKSKFRKLWQNLLKTLFLGNSLYTLLKNSKGDPNAEETNIVIESLRQAKVRIDEYGFAELTDVTDLIKNQGASLGPDLQGIVTTSDVKDLSVHDGTISLHKDLVPFYVSKVRVRRDWLHYQFNWPWLKMGVSSWSTRWSKD